MGSPVALIAIAIFFAASGIVAILMEQRWTGAILSLLFAATLVGFGVRMLVTRRSEEES